MITDRGDFRNVFSLMLVWCGGGFAQCCLVYSVSAACGCTRSKVNGLADLLEHLQGPITAASSHRRPAYVGPSLLCLCRSSKKEA